MQQIKQRWYAKPLSLYLSIAIAFTSLVFSLAIGRQAHAQTVNRLPTWAVLDFVNSTKYGGSDIGREAGDSLVIELGNSNRFNVITRGDVVNGLNTLGIQPPLDAIDIQRVGKQIGADAIVTGEVLAVTQKTDPAQVQAVVAVRVTDVSSGELINGALAEGLSTPRPGAVIDQDTMVNEALGKAAFAAVKQITSYQLPEPTIINNEGPDTVLLNMGSRDGIQPGMNMLVRRNGTEVGRIRVGEVEDDESTAVVSESTLGVRPGDHARAIYSLPDYAVRGGVVVTDSGSLATGNAVQAKRSNSFSGIGGVILAILAAGLLVALVQHGSSNGNLGGGTTSVAARAASQGEYGLQIDPNFGAELGAVGTAYIGLDTMAAGQAFGVHVTWTTGNINPTDIIGFNIYRDSFEPFTEFLSSTSTSTSTSTSGSTTTTTSTTTTATSTSTVTSTAGIVGQFPLGPVAAEPATVRQFTDTGFATIGEFLFVFDKLGSSSGSTSTSTSGSTSTSSSSSSTTSGSTSTSTSTSTSGTTAGLSYYDGIGDGLVDVPGVLLGSPQHYGVTAVYSLNVPTATGTVPGFEETPVQSAQSGLATPILPVDVAGSSSDVTINGSPAFGNGVGGVAFNGVVFSFLTSFGPTEYIVDVSDTAEFKKKLTLGPIGTSTQAGISESFNRVNLLSTFPNATQLYFRFGSRYAADSPGPVIDNGLYPNPTAFSGGGSYVYSVTQTMRTTAL